MYYCTIPHAITSLYNFLLTSMLPYKPPTNQLYHNKPPLQALDAFAKSKKEFAIKAKDLKAEMMELGAHLQAANEAKK